MLYYYRHHIVCYHDIFLYPEPNVFDIPLMILYIQCILHDLKIFAPKSSTFLKDVLRNDWPYVR